MSPKMRTKDDMMELREGLYAILARDHPLHVRQVAYQAVVHGLIAKTESEMHDTVGRLLTRMREDGTIPFEWIAESGRPVREPPVWESAAEALAWLAEAYRRDPWQGQAHYVEVWIEKEGLVSVVKPETDRYAVRVLPVKGDSSVTAMHEAARRFPTDREVHVLYFGDWDPVGEDILRVLEEKLVRYRAPAFTLTRMALTPEQVATYQLPTRPTKRRRGMRNAAFEGDSVELDALPAEVLRQLVEEAIAPHVDLGVRAAVEQVDETEKPALRALAQRWRRRQDR